LLLITTKINDMDKEKLESIVRKSVEDVWYNRRSLNPVEEQTKALTDVIWSELEQRLNSSGIGSKRHFSPEQVVEVVNQFEHSTRPINKRLTHKEFELWAQNFKAACASGGDGKVVSGGENLEEPKYYNAGYKPGMENYEG
jgi:hypothetical protein